MYAWFSSVSWVLVIAAFGCSAEEHQDASLADSGDALLRHGDAAPSDASAPDDPITLTGFVRSFAGGAMPVGDALEGVTVCILDTTACQVTSTDGRYDVVVQRDAPFGLSYEKAGYTSALRLGKWHEDVPLLGDTLLPSTEQTEAIVAASGGDPSRVGELGAIQFVGLTENPSGFDIPRLDVSVQLEPAAGVGPAYMNEMNVPDPTLTSTSAAGWGLFVDVPEGDYSVHFASDGAVCDDTHPLGGWPASNPEAVRTIVRPGFVTLSMQLSCIDAGSAMP